MNRGGHTRWISINWDGWDFSGSAASDSSIPSVTGVEVLERILRSGETNVAVSVTDLEARLQQWIRPRTPKVAVVEAPALEAPAIDARAPLDRSESDSALSEAERRIAAIWEDLLGVERVKADDDFFELGGHSLLAMRVAARLREEFDVAVSARVVLESVTLGQLAAAVAEAVATEIALMSETE
jgi:phthiocerol/phenolphthiocerol synthesis type-I polyketide synthase E